MARFSLSFLALCFFLALMASALPAKRDDGDLDAGDAVAAALATLKAFDEGDKEKNDKSDKTTVSHGANNMKEATPVAQPVPSGTRTTVQTPAAASSSTAAAPKKTSSTDNMLSHIPLLGPVLGGGAGLGSLLPTR